MPKAIKYFDDWVANLPSLEGKVVAVTGSTSGTGYWFVVCAIRKGAKSVLLLNRASGRVASSVEELEKEKSACESLTEIITVDCDLQDFESVRAAAAKVNELCAERGGLSVLANNAGIMAFPDNRTKDGFDVQIQTNHLSHWLLTKLVWPSFQKAVDEGKEVRICQHSSGARNLGSTFQEKYFKKCAKNTLGGGGIAAKFRRYHVTKLANTTFAMKLHDELKKHGYDVSKIKSVVAEPGVSETSLVTNNDTYGAILGGIFNLGLKLMSTQHAADGALPMIEACFGSEVDSGDFFYPKGKTVGPPYKAISQGKIAGGKKASAEKNTLSPAHHELIWKVSEEAFETPFFDK